jgi:hypothetical protein
MLKTIFKNRLLILVLVILSFTFGVNAQNNTLDVQIMREFQDPQTKEFRLIGIIKSDIDSSRVTATWELPNGLETDEDLINENITLSESGEQITLEVEPIGIVNGKVTLTVDVHEVDSRYSSTQSGNIMVNSDLEVVPTPDAYRSISSMTGIRNAFTNLFTFSLVTFIIIFIIRKFASRKEPLHFVSKTPIDSKIIKELSRRKNKV